MGVGWVDDYFLIEFYRKKRYPAFGRIDNK